MSEAEKSFWKEAGVRPEEAKDLLADRPVVAGSHSTGGGSLSDAEQQAFWAEAGITPEELGLGRASGQTIIPPRTMTPKPNFILHFCVLMPAHQGVVCGAGTVHEAAVLLLYSA